MGLVGQRVGHIRIEEMLGSGGMGEVYRGLDETLEREVAVKTLSADRRLGHEARVRFLREARLLSKLDHPSICRVYDLVEGDDADFLVMELIRGRTLSSAVRDGLCEVELLRVLVAVAEALAAAHDAHIVHRDLKPDNVMLTDEGQVKVLDFGIARSLDSAAVRVQREPARDPPSPGDVGRHRPGVDPTATLERWREAGQAAPATTRVTSGQSLTLATHHGSILGTPRYMSPEQAGGGPLTEASDMYSFGVMLQEILTGEPPYGDSQGMDLLLRVYRAETAPVRGVDPELAQLVAELENVDPTARPTAAEAARRLRWYLDRPARGRRRRIRVAATAAVLGLLAVAAGVAVHSRLEASHRAALGRRFAQQSESIAWMMRAEHLSPPHDLRPARERVRAMIADLERQIDELGAPAVAPGHAAIGRGLLALDDYEAAIGHLRTAWESGERSPDLAFDLGHCYGQLYLEALARQTWRDDPEVAEMQRERARTLYRAPALEFLEQATGASTADPRYLEAMLALYDGRVEDGLEAVRTLDHTPAWSAERHRLEAELHFLEARRRGFVAADLEGHLTALDRAEAALEAAIGVARSDPEPRELLCRIAYSRYHTMYVLRHRDDPVEPIERAVERCRETLALDAGLTSVHATVSSLLVLRGIVEEYRNLEPFASYARALEACNQGLALRPDDATLHHARGLALTRRGWYAVRRGGDARPDLEQAIEDLRRALELAPGDPASWLTLGDTYYALTARALWRGEDPVRWLDDGISHLEEFARANPEYVRVHDTLGTLLLLKARDLAAGGREATGTFERAIASYSRAAGSSTGPLDAYNLGLAQVELAAHQVEHGGNPGPQLEAAETALDTAVERGATFGEIHLLRALCWLARARHAGQRGEDPSPAVAEGLRVSERGIALSPSNMEAHTERAALHLVRARHRLRSRQSPEADLVAARESLARTLALNPDHAAAHRALAEVEVVAARWRAGAGGDPEQSLAAADAAVTRALEANPREADSHRVRAEICLWRAAWRLGHGGSGSDDLAAGLEASTRALEINPRLAGAELTRAGLLTLEARSAAASPAASRARQEAAAAMARAVAVNPAIESHARELLALLEGRSEEP